MTFVLYLIDANNGLIWNGTQNGFDAVVDSLSSVSWLLMMYLCVLLQDTGDGEIDIEIPEGVGPGDTFEVSLDTGGGGAADDGLDGLNIDALLQGASDDEDEEDEEEEEEEGPGVTMDMMVTCPEGTSAGQPILITTEWGADVEVVRGRQMTD